MGLLGVRAKVGGVLEGSDRLVVASQRLKREAQLLAGERVCRTVAHGLLERTEGLGELLLAEEQRSEIEVGCGS